MLSISKVILAFLFYGNIVASDFDSRIVGGIDAKLGEVPYIVSIRRYNKHGCGGSILNEKYVLSAAHCVYGWDTRPQYFTIQYGIVKITQTEPNVLPVKKIKIHEDYVHSGIYPNDICLLEVDGTFNFGPNAKPVGLPSPFENPNEDALLAGWGLNKSGGQVMLQLQKVLIEILPDNFCQQSDEGYNSELQLCAGIRAGGKGQCTGDSGGPLTVDNKQFGIVSWSNKPCASYGNPGYFTKVTHHRNWIRMQIGV